jgi:hypothetical protein
MFDEKEDTRQEPTPEEQAEFDELWERVLLARETVVFGTPEGEAKWLEILGGKAQNDRYYQMRETLKVKLWQEQSHVSMSLGLWIRGIYDGWRKRHLNRAAYAIYKRRHTPS